MLTMSQWPLRTDRLTIRPGTPDDAEAAHRLRTLPEVAEWIPIFPAMPLADFAALYTSPQRMPCFLVVERDGQMVGELLLRVDDAFAQLDVRERAVGSVAEIGWLVHPDHQRQGLATEAVRRLLQHCFEDLGLHRVVAEAFAGNTGTARLAPKVGMRLEATHVKAAMHRDRGWVDTVTYAILAEEWSS